jgi:hypothetical protein
MKTLIISQFSEDISWINNLNYEYKDIRIYTKNIHKNFQIERISQVNVIPENKGQEASAYLKYIIDNFENLSEYSIFVHAHEYSPHHIGSISDILNDIIDMKTYYHNFNNYKLGYILTNPIIEWVTKWYVEYLEPEIGPISDYGDWTFGHQGCGQFLVHNSVIKSRPLELYQKLYNWIITTNLPNEWTSRFMEWTWHLIWNQVPKKIKL